MKKVSSFTLPAVVVGLSIARKREKLKWITDFEVTKFSTIILGVERLLLLLIAFEGRHHWVNHLMAVAYIFVWSVNTIARKERHTKNVFKYARLEINFVINGNEFKFQFACIFERRENLVSNFTLLHSSWFARWTEAIGGKTHKVSYKEATT